MYIYIYIYAHLFIAPDLLQSLLCDLRSMLWLWAAFAVQAVQSAEYKASHIVQIQIRLPSELTPEVTWRLCTQSLPMAILSLLAAE